MRGYIAGSALLATIAAMGDTRCQPAQAEAGPPPEKVWVCETLERGFPTVRRCEDRQKHVVCWIAAGSHEYGVSCLPFSNADRAGDD